MAYFHLFELDHCMGWSTERGNKSNTLLVPHCHDGLKVLKTNVSIHPPIHPSNLMSRLQQASPVMILVSRVRDIYFEKPRADTVVC